LTKQKSAQNQQTWGGVTEVDFCGTFFDQMSGEPENLRGFGGMSWILRPKELMKNFEILASMIFHAK